MVVPLTNTLLQSNGISSHHSYSVIVFFSKVTTPSSLTDGYRTSLLRLVYFSRPNQVPYLQLSRMICVSALLVQLSFQIQSQSFSTIFLYFLPFSSSPTKSYCGVLANISATLALTIANQVFIEYLINPSSVLSTTSNWEYSFLNCQYFMKR